MKFFLYFISALVAFILMFVATVSFMSYIGIPLSVVLMLVVLILINFINRK